MDGHFPTGSPKKRMTSKRFSLYFNWEFCYDGSSIQIDSVSAAVIHQSIKDQRINSVSRNLFSHRGPEMTAHRKLIRSKIKEVKENAGQKPEMSQPVLPSGVQSGFVTRRKQIPAEQTNAESFYYLKQMQTKTPMVIILDDGEQIRGYIEWYDKHCLKINRHKEPNLMVMKHCIKYIFKQEDEVKSHRRRKRTPSEPIETGDKKTGPEKNG